MDIAKPKSGFYLNIGENQLLSLSPEKFFEVKDNIISTYPIKGTIERSEDVIEDKTSEGQKFKTKNSTLFKAIMTVIIADASMSLDNVLGVAGAAKQHYILLIFGLVLSILLMATVATIISKWIKKYKWIGWLGLLAILAVAIDLIYSDLKIFI